MLIDKEMELSDEQAVTTSAASSSSVDLGVGGAGVLEGLHCVVTVKEAAAAAGAAKVTFKLQGDNASDFASAEDIAISADIAKADLVLGKQIILPMPASIDHRYVRGYFSVSTGPLTAGKFDLQFVDGIQKNKAYADAL